MKADIHPVYFPEAKITCACGSTFTTGSTQELIRVEICAKCHPFFTGQQKFVDTLGQVDKFQKRSEEAKVKLEQKKAIVDARRARTATEKIDKPSLKDLLMQARKNLHS